MKKRVNTNSRTRQEGTAEAAAAGDSGAGEPGERQIELGKSRSVFECGPLSAEIVHDVVQSMEQASRVKVVNARK